MPDNNLFTWQIQCKDDVIHPATHPAIMTPTRVKSGGVPSLNNMAEITPPRTKEPSAVKSAKDKIFNENANPRAAKLYISPNLTAGTIISITINYVLI